MGAHYYFRRCRDTTRHIDSGNFGALIESIYARHLYTPPGATGVEYGVGQRHSQRLGRRPLAFRQQMRDKNAAVILTCRLRESRMTGEMHDECAGMRSPGRF